MRLFFFDAKTRTGRYLRTLGSSLILFGCATLYSLGIIPLVIAYEDTASLGLWILISQIGLWLGALDLGLSASSVRFFVGPVARGDIAELRPRFHVTLFLTGLQSLAIALLGFTGPLLGSLLSIPAAQAELFHDLLLTQCLVGGASFFSRPFASLLLAAQRFELNYLGNAFSFVLSLGLAWVGLSQGWGLWSLMAGWICQYLFSFFLSIYGVHKLGFLFDLLADFNIESRLILKTVSESFSFAVGSLAGIAGGILQSVFLSRCFGLEMVAAWNVGAKMATVLGQILSKFFESSFSGLSELLETGQRSRMFGRFGQLLGWSSVLSTALALLLLFANEPFIRMWTKGEIAWPTSGTLAVTLMLVVGTCHRALAEAIKILVLWNPIRFGPLVDLGTTILCLLGAYALGGFSSFTFAAALGPFLGGLIVNFYAFSTASARPLTHLVPKRAQLLFLLLFGVYFLAAFWLSFS